MKTLIVYYSYDGNSALIASELGDLLGADIVRVETVDDKKRMGFSKYVWGGAQVFSKALPDLKPYTVNLEQYDLIVLGTPVWAGAPAPAMNSFLNKAKINGKNIALFICHMGGKAKAFEIFKKKLEGNTVVGEIDFISPSKLDRQELGQVIGAWAEKLKA
ncbi:MAG: flavodoxin [Termitinemataceae bacterium]|nr:MAG: flavodoxin [Termitinemataceae bacterium]